MFPIPWNKLFRKKDGSLTTIDEAISSGGGGDPYTLPTASAETKGGIKIGSGLTMTGEVLSADDQLPASTSADEDKVLTVGSDGTPGWATPGGGGGGGLSYVDVTFNALSVPANSFADNSATIGSNNYPELIGKRIVSVVNINAPAYIYCLGASRQSDPIAANDWIYLLFYNNSASAGSVTKARIFYE